MASRKSKWPQFGASHTGNADFHKLTVVQLRKKLSDHNIFLEKSDKKAKLIELCIQHGLDLHVQQPLQTAAEQSVVEDNTIFTLTKTVAELQKSVLSLSGDVNKLLQRDIMGDKVASISNQERSTDLQRDSDNTPFMPALAGQIQPTDSSSGTSGFTKFGYSAESLPFIETIHPTLKKQLIEGKDVNLASLLIPYYTGQHSDSSTLINSKEKPDPRLNNPLTFGQFIQAFGIYKNIMCDTYPARRQELDLYERDIVDMATKYNGKGFYEYHKAFSAQAAAHLKFSNKKVDWSIRNNKLFASIFVNQPALSCYLCQSSLHMTAFCPNQLNKGKFQNSSNKANSQSMDIRGRIRIQYNGQEICNNFNSVRGCSNPKCRNVHVCLTCKKEHSQQSCNNAKNYPTPNANNQK